MKKRYKLVVRGESVLILHWETEGQLFGPGWVCIADFYHSDANVERIRKIVGLMNKCDQHIDENDDD